MSKVGLVLEGGALRGVYSAGVIDFFLDEQLEFPYVIGVSAGMGNMVCFGSRQRGRAKRVIMHEGAQPYFGLGQYHKSKKILNLDMIVDEYALETFPFDFDTFFSNPAKMECVVTNCETGETEYRDNLRDQESLFANVKASCSVPFVCQPVEMGGYHYLDGSITDSIPIDRAFEKGCDKVVVVLTRPAKASATDYSIYRPVINRMYRSYPMLCKALIDRKTRYIEQVKHMEELERQGKVFIIRPTDASIGHFERNNEKLEGYYQLGYNDTLNRFDELKEFLS